MKKSKLFLSVLAATMLTGGVSSHARPLARAKKAEAGEKAAAGKRSSGLQKALEMGRASMKRGFAKGKKAAGGKVAGKEKANRDASLEKALEAEIEAEAKGLVAETTEKVAGDWIKVAEAAKCQEDAIKKLKDDLEASRKLQGKDLETKLQAVAKEAREAASKKALEVMKKRCEEEVGAEFKSDAKLALEAFLKRAEEAKPDHYLAYLSGDKAALEAHVRDEAKAARELASQLAPSSTAERIAPIYDDLKGSLAFNDAEAALMGNMVFLGLNGTDSVDLVKELSRDRSVLSEVASKLDKIAVARGEANLALAASGQDIVAKGLDANAFQSLRDSNSNEKIDQRVLEAVDALGKLKEAGVTSFYNGVVHAENPAEVELLKLVAVEQNFLDNPDSQPKRLEYLQQIDTCRTLLTQALQGNLDNPYGIGNARVSDIQTELATKAGIAALGNVLTADDLDRLSGAAQTVEGNANLTLALIKAMTYKVDGNSQKLLANIVDRAPEAAYALREFANLPENDRLERMRGFTINGAQPMASDIALDDAQLRAKKAAVRSFAQASYYGPEEKKARELCDKIRTDLFQQAETAGGRDFLRSVVAEADRGLMDDGFFNRRGIRFEGGNPRHNLVHTPSFNRVFKERSGLNSLKETMALLKEHDISVSKESEDLLSQLMALGGKSRAEARQNMDNVIKGLKEAEKALYAQVDSLPSAKEKLVFVNDLLSNSSAPYNTYMAESVRSYIEGLTDKQYGKASLADHVKRAISRREVLEACGNQARNKLGRARNFISNVPKGSLKNHMADYQPRP